MNRSLLFAFFFFLICADPAFAFKATLLLEHAQPSAWNDLLISGLKKGAAEVGGAAQIMALEPYADKKAALAKAAGESDLVIVAGDAMRDVLMDNAGNFRRVKFGCVDASVRAANVSSVAFADEQAAFLAGVAAAALAGTQNGERAAGWLSAADTPAMRSLFEGFSQGARMDHPETRVIQGVVNSFVNPAEAARKALWLAERGAKVVVVAAGAGSKAAAEALAGKNVTVIDVDALRPDSPAVGAIVKDIEKAVAGLVRDAANGSFRGKEIAIYNLENNGVDFVFKKEAPGVTRRLRERLGELRKEIIDGSIKLPSLRQKALCDCLD